MIALDGFGFLGPVSGGAPITPPGLPAGKRTVYTAVLLKNGRLFNYRAADVDPETRADLERSKARGEVARYVNFYEVSDERAGEYAKSLRAEETRKASGVFASVFRDAKITKTTTGLVRIGANAAKTAIASRGGKIALVAVAVGAVAAVGFYVMKKRKGGTQ